MLLKVYHVTKTGAVSLDGDACLRATCGRVNLTFRSTSMTPLLRMPAFSKRRMAGKGGRCQHYRIRLCGKQMCARWNSTSSLSLVTSRTYWVPENSREKTFLSEPLPKIAPNSSSGECSIPEQPSIAPAFLSPSFSLDPHDLQHGWQTCVPRCTAAQPPEARFHF